MPRPRPKPPDDIKKLLELVACGRLFAVQEWMEAGKRVNYAESERWEFCPLYWAAETGFHSMVELLLRAKAWTQDELDETIKSVMSAGRTDMMELLLSAGAAPLAIDFADICRKVDLPLLERLLRLGADPEKDNGFARGMVEVGARPLLAFYRMHREEFPGLHRQASLALAEAVTKRKHRLTALLAWAGADPWMPVPNTIYDHWDFDDYTRRVAAEDAALSKDVELLKSLKLKPNPEQAQELLYHACIRPSGEVFDYLLRLIPKTALNAEKTHSCKAVELLVKMTEHSWNYRTEEQEEEDDLEVAKCLERLLDAGAVWNPEPSDVDYARRRLSQRRARHVARMLRLLFFTPKAAPVSALRKLISTPLLVARVAPVDSPLAEDLRAWRDQVSGD
jgi:uncharacterized protein YciW